MVGANFRSRRRGATACVSLGDGEVARLRGWRDTRGAREDACKRLWRGGLGGSSRDLRWSVLGPWRRLWSRSNGW